MKTTKQVPIRYDDTRKAFEDLHEAGARNFGSLWLAANMAITEHAQSRVDISDPAVKELLSLCAYRVLVRLNANGDLKKP